MNLGYAFFLERSVENLDDEYWMHIRHHAIDVIEGGRFPHTSPRLSAVVQIRLQPAERGPAYEVAAELRDSQGNLVIGRDQRILKPLQNGPRNDLPSQRHVLFTFLEPTFPEPGKYWLRVIVDDVEVGQVPLHVIRRPRAM